MLTRYYIACSQPHENVLSPWGVIQIVSYCRDLIVLTAHLLIVLPLSQVMLIVELVV